MDEVSGNAKRDHKQKPSIIWNSRTQECHWVNPDYAIACSEHVWVLHLDGDLSDR
jgi:hypothetical protein